jgi:hemerythrin
MDHFVWKDSFAVGIQEIDDQHKLFLEYVNECYNAVHLDRTRQVTNATIHDLTVYAETHFQFEQAIMQEIGYSDLAGQEEEHGYFVNRLAELEQALAEGRKSTVESLLVFLKEWFLTHIIDHDKRLADFIILKKVKLKNLKCLARAQS